MQKSQVNKSSCNLPKPGPINSNVVTRWLTKMALKYAELTGRVGGVTVLGPVCIKVKPMGSPGLSEALAMRFVKENTSVPVPKVYCSFQDGEAVYIVMEKMKGQWLSHNWSDWGPESKASVAQQLKNMLAELHAIVPPPGTGICSVDGGPFEGPFIAQSESYWHGPFKNVQEFHNFLHNYQTWAPDNLPLINDMLSMHSEDWPTCFTHGDLSNSNVLTQGDKVTGIIDWGSSAWLPSYWEYTASKKEQLYGEFWFDYIDEILEPLPYEFEMEQVRTCFSSPVGPMIEIPGPGEVYIPKSRMPPITGVSDLSNPTGTSPSSSQSDLR